MNTFEIDAVASEVWNCAFPCKCYLGEGAPRSGSGGSPPTTSGGGTASSNSEGGHHHHHHAPAPPVYFMIPRLGYLYQCIPTILEHFYDSETPKGSIWFAVRVPPQQRANSASVSANRRAVNSALGVPTTTWEVPMFYSFAVLMDMLAAASSSSSSHHQRPALPVELELRFDPPVSPTTMTLRTTSYERDGVVMLRQQQKGASAVMFGSSAPLLLLEPTILDTLTSSLRTNNGQEFFSARNVLVGKGIQQAQRLKGTMDTLAVVAPFTFHILQNAHTPNGKKKNSSNNRSRSGDDDDDEYSGGIPETEPLSVCVDCTLFPTFGCVLRYFLPCCASLKDDECRSSEPLSSSIAVVLVSGSRPSLCTPTEFMHQWLCSGDFVVHVVVSSSVSNCWPSEGPRQRVRCDDNNCSVDSQCAPSPLLKGSIDANPQLTTGFTSAKFVPDSVEELPPPPAGEPTTAVETEEKKEEEEQEMEQQGSTTNDENEGTLSQTTRSIYEDPTI